MRAFISWISWIACARCTGSEIVCGGGDGSDAAAAALSAHAEIATPAILASNMDLSMAHPYFSHWNLRKSDQVAARGNSGIARSMAEAITENSSYRTLAPTL